MNAWWCNEIGLAFCHVNVQRPIETRLTNVWTRHSNVQSTVEPKLNYVWTSAISTCIAPSTRYGCLSEITPYHRSMPHRKIWVLTDTMSDHCSDHIRHKMKRCMRCCHSIVPSTIETSWNPVWNYVISMFRAPPKNCRVVWNYAMSTCILPSEQDERMSDILSY